MNSARSVGSRRKKRTSAAPEFIRIKDKTSMKEMAGLRSSGQRIQDVNILVDFSGLQQLLRSGFLSSFKSVMAFSWLLSVVIDSREFGKS